MLTPIEMLAKKNRLSTWMTAGLLVTLLVAGCAPSGSRLVFRAKKLLDAGDYAGAVEELRTATTLLPTDAAVWNYLGVACQKAQQPDNAIMAYQRALTLDRDLVEAHWNLGMAYLEQNKNDQALAEFTAYTLRRNNNPEGWLKLAATQLRLGQIAPAEASFGWVLRLDHANAEAYNGLGLAQLERNRPREAMQYFTAAVRQNPGYAAAIQNLAVTAQEYLRDYRTALQYYQAYLALTPRPGNWDDVNAEANSLEQSLSAAPPSLAVAVAPRPTPPPMEQAAPAPPVAPLPMWSPETRKSPAAATARPLSAKPQWVARTYAAPVTAHAVTTSAPTQRYQPTLQPTATQSVATAAKTPVSANPQVDAAPTEATSKQGFWDRMKPTHWFAGGPNDPKYQNTGVTPLPDVNDAHAAETAAERPVEASSFPRYAYLSPARPAPGDRRAASGSFTSARVFEQDARWVDAMQAYRSAAEFDPGWYEAQFNFGVLAARLGNYRQSLHAYETAIAIEPNSLDAHYNFAMTLKAAGYVPDAINELKRTLSAHPDDVRTHLALGNLYAQKMHDTAQAREHYVKVLQLDPDNAEAADIRSWLSASEN